MDRKNGAPVWSILKNGSSEPVSWIDHGPNPRFAVYSSKGGSDPSRPGHLSDDLVLDKETGLVWPRNADHVGQCSWLDANTLCREFVLGNRSGWRLPAVEELSSLLDPEQVNLALPSGHPFINIQYGSGVPAYWTSTNYENPGASAWFVNFWRGAGPHLTGLAGKGTLCHVWPVRGGVVGINWN